MILPELNHIPPIGIQAMMITSMDITLTANTDSFPSIIPRITGTGHTSHGMIIIITIHGIIRGIIPGIPRIMVGEGIILHIIIIQGIGGIIQ